MMKPDPAGPARQPGGDPAAAGNMMEGMREQKRGSNPVIDALKTIQVAIASMQEKGDPKAQAIMQAFQALLQAFQGQGGEEAPPEAEASGANQPESAPKESARRYGMNQSKGTQRIM